MGLSKDLFIVHQNTVHVGFGAEMAIIEYYNADVNLVFTTTLVVISHEINTGARPCNQLNAKGTGMEKVFGFHVTSLPKC